LIRLWGKFIYGILDRVQKIRGALCAGILASLLLNRTGKRKRR